GRLPNPKTAEEVTIDAMMESALSSAKMAQEYGMGADKIVISVKMSHVQDVIKAYTALAAQCDYALHVGLTEAGMGFKGAVASTAARANLLQQGIGDTIRVSLTPAPGGDRTEEVRICQHILQSLELRQFSPSVTACPGCGRTTNSLFQEMSLDMENFFKEKLPVWKKQGYKGVEGLKIAVMGCIVNGPGESKNANIGISLPGTGENPKAPVFIDGQKVKTLEGPQMMSDFKKLVEEYVQRKYSN
ncbi:MAG: flavodoxin-dependent (E)-4-hydroxy-3-methylbut-2-enyl-diphosphate synthase, partial [Deltaproteobacteria bacterium]|nr:flavodoxin-dependent (E)-4-hydroxy-3-methylbut-2-enyl-diphosphate synthase [Deltaproteobacteria bacterium]